MTELELQELHTNIQQVQFRIAQAAERSGRKPTDIQLVAASKMNNAERIRAAVQNGVCTMGENRVQELLEKYDQNAYIGANLHFIGTLQTNKVKYLMGKASLIHSVGSVKLGSCIAKEAQKHNICQDILIEVNIGSEPAKSGVLPEDLEPTIEQLCALQGIRIRGLMAIPPIAHASGENLRYFDRMRQLFIDMAEKRYDNVSMDYLSMGMSGDFEDAISCGANMVRIGSAIFGLRPYMRQLT